MWKKKFKLKQEIKTKKPSINPEAKLVISFICLKEDWKELKKDNNSLKDLITWIRLLEDQTVQQFLDKNRSNWWFSKEKENQPNYNDFKKWTVKFRNHKQKIVEAECYIGNNYWHCHINSWRSQKLIRLFWILNNFKFCIVNIDWEWDNNH